MTAIRRDGALACLWVIAAVAVVAGWAELTVSNDLLDVNTGQAVFFTLSALAAPVLAAAMRRRHPAESTGVLLGAGVLAAMLGACRTADLGPVSVIAGVTALVLPLLPALIVARYSMLQYSRAVAALVVVCFWAAAVLGASISIILLTTGSVPGPVWFTQPAGRGSSVAVGLLIVEAAAVAVAATAIVIGHYQRPIALNARRALRPMMWPAMAWCVSVTASAIWTVIECIRSPLRFEIAGDDSTTFIVVPTVLVGLIAAGVGWIDLTLRTRSSAANIATQLGRGMNVEHYLSRALADTSIRVLYPVENSEWVNADGRTVNPDVANGDRASTVIVRGSTVIGLIDQDAAITGRPDAVELVATGAGLIMETERLMAAAARDLEQARLLAERLLSASDEPRAALRASLLAGPLAELDVVAADLRAGASIAAIVPRLSGVAAQVRTISHGVFPASLATGGLRAALDRSAVPDCRYSPVVEMTAYLATFDDPGATIEETICADGPALAIGISRPPSTDVGDRVMALGGTVNGADLDNSRWSIILPTSLAG